MILRSEVVELRPLREASFEDLRAASAPEDVWRLMPIRLGSDEDLRRYVADAIAAEDAGTQIPFAVYRDGKLIGSTRFARIERANRSAEIGFTWYHPSQWRTAVNTACKILLLDYAFGDFGLHRVYFRVDTRNERSQNAVRRLGGVFEGILREEMVLPDGYIRSTAIFSILAPEWPAHRARLLAR